MAIFPVQLPLGILTQNFNTLTPANQQILRMIFRRKQRTMTIQSAN